MTQFHVHPSYINGVQKAEKNNGTRERTPKDRPVKGSNFIIKQVFEIFGHNLILLIFLRNNI